MQCTMIRGNLHIVIRAKSAVWIACAVLATIISSICFLSRAHVSAIASDIARLEERQEITRVLYRQCVEQSAAIQHAIMSDGDVM